MEFEWDPAKRAANRRKHGVDFADAVGALEDPLAVTLEDPDCDEVRFITLGLDLLGRLVAVCWTHRGDNLRLISARRATRLERRAYEEN